MIEDDDEHGWKAVRKGRQEKRHSNLQYSTQLLRENGIEFVAKNDGIHLIISTTPAIDFYPSTGLWIERGTNIKGRGVRKLLNYLKGKNNVSQ